MSSTAEALNDMHGLAERVGHDAWIERRLFEVLGAWTADSGSDEVTLHFDAASRRHGWHAQLCFERLPYLASVDAEALVVAPGPATEVLMDALGAVVGDVDRLQALYSVVLPEVVVRHRRLRDSAPTVSAASVRRWYGFIVEDDTEELLDGFALISDRAADAAKVSVAGLRDLLAASVQLSA